MFQIGQKFIGGYPEAAAEWCNENGIAHIEEIDWQQGKPEEARQFIIVANSARVETPEEMQARYTALAQEALDAFARSRGYDSIMSACSYYGSTDPQFSAEAEYCMALRDRTWRKGYEILNAVMAGTMELPTEDAFLAMLPVADAAWPSVQD